MSESITSTRNPKIKNIIHLRKSGERKKQNLIIIEGEKEVEKALLAGIRITGVFLCKEYLNDELNNLVKKNIDDNHIYYLSPEVFNHIAVRKNSGGVVALGTPVYSQLIDLDITPNSIFIILEKVEKPGNLGAILRTADAAGVDGILLCDNQTDIFNPNVIRSSLGCVFTKKIAVAESNDVYEWTKKHHIKTYATYLETDQFYHKQNYKTPLALIMGAEDEGLDEFWVQHADLKIKIPMSGMVDSMNVSVSAAIVLFEILRQRDFQR